MLFWMFVIITVVSFLVYEFLDIEFTDLIGILGIVISTFMLIGIIVSNCSAKGYLVANQEKYKSLIYKVETEEVRDEFGIINKEYIDEIQRWNEDVVKYKAMQRDFWIGIFYPNIFDEFETIDLEDIQYKK